MSIVSQCFQRLKGLPCFVGQHPHQPLSAGKVLLHRLHHRPALPGAQHQIGLGQLLGGTGIGLGQAAGEGHHRQRMLPAQPPHDLPGLFIPRRGDGAGVDDVEFCLLGRGHNLIPSAAEQFLHRLGFVLVHLAAQCIKCSPHGPPPCPKSKRRQKFCFFCRPT